MTNQSLEHLLLLYAILILSSPLVPLLQSIHCSIYLPSSSSLLRAGHFAALSLHLSLLFFLLLHFPLLLSPPLGPPNHNRPQTRRQHHPQPRHRRTSPPNPYRSHKRLSKSRKHSTHPTSCQIVRRARRSRLMQIDIHNQCAKHIERASCKIADQEEHYQRTG